MVGRIDMSPVLLVVAISTAYATVEPTPRAISASRPDEPPCESRTVWTGDCMTPQPVELRWRDPVAEYTSDVLCAGECMVVPLPDTINVQDHAEEISPFDREELDRLMAGSKWRSWIVGVLRGLRDFALPGENSDDDDR